MKIKSKILRFTLFSGVWLFVAACSESNSSFAQQSVNEIVLNVYKRAQCSCCSKWMSHASDNGFKMIGHNQNDLSEIKNKYGIHAKLRSCHTSVSSDGFVFEGHIPAKFIKRFLAEKPHGATGLTVAGMPTGTPGMEFGDLFRPYKIYLLKDDASVEIYAEVNTSEEQI